MDREVKVEILDTRYHRNGVGGLGVQVTLFRDPDQEGDFVAIDFGPEVDKLAGGVSCAVLNTDRLHDGDIRFGYNSWRGDAYGYAVRAALAARPEEVY